MKIEERVAKHFRENIKLKVGNNEIRVVIIDGLTQMFYRGNKIAEKNTLLQQLILDTHTWKTNTTKNRLNLIDGVHVVQREGLWYLNGEYWDGNKKTINIQTD